MNHLHIGIDVSSADLVVCLLDHQGQRLDNVQTMENSLPGAEKLESLILEIAKKIRVDQILIGTESTSVYDLHIADFLASSVLLKPLNTSLFRFNAKVIANFKKAYLEENKTDPGDAFIIADRLRFRKPDHPYTAHLPHLPLQRLTRYRVHIVDSIRKETQYFLMHLFLKYNRFSNMEIFSNTMGTTSISLINDFSCEELASMSIEEITSFIIQKSKNRCRDPHKIALTVQRALRESYRLRPTMAQSVDLILSGIHQNIRALKASLKQLNKAIEDQFKAFPNTLTSVAGIGPVFAAGIYAEIGDVSRFAHDSQLAKFAGLTWKISQSGQFTAEETRLTGRGNQFLRYYLCEAANSLRVHNEEYKTYYSKKFDEVPKHRHKRAIVLTARKLVRLVFALLAKKQLYDTSLPADRS
ncbi:MAG: IS110 family transposase [Candidatus Omnitrophica bacterium]|nr:IS110 family transposase [Candidatus Omnitrophota bacterium]